MHKDAWLVFLVGLNLTLLAALLLSVYEPPAAFAQEAGNDSGFILVSAEAELDNEATYLLDVRNNRLHAFRTTFPHLPGQPVAVGHVAYRELRADFDIRGRRKEGER